VVFDNAEDIETLKKVGLNVAALTGVMLFLIVLAAAIG